MQWNPGNLHADSANSMQLNEPFLAISGRMLFVCEDWKAVMERVIGRKVITPSEMIFPSTLRYLGMALHENKDRLQDLVATTHKSYDTKPWMRAQVKVKKATNADALREADFRNVAFLHKFTSETGNLPPRKVTKLQKKFHTHVMRQIKVGVSSLPEFAPFLVLLLFCSWPTLLSYNCA